MWNAARQGKLHYLEGCLAEERRLDLRRLGVAGAQAVIKGRRGKDTNEIAGAIDRRSSDGYSHIGGALQSEGRCQWDWRTSKTPQL